MGVAEIHRRTKTLRYLNLRCRLRSLIPSDRPRQTRRQIPHPQLQRLMQRLAIPPCQVRQPHRPDLPFNHRVDGGALILTEDEIAFLTLLWVISALS